MDWSFWMVAGAKQKQGDFLSESDSHFSRASVQRSCFEVFHIIRLIVVFLERANHTRLRDNLSSKEVFLQSSPILWQPGDTVFACKGKKTVSPFTRRCSICAHRQGFGKHLKADPGGSSEGQTPVISSGSFPA